MTEATLKSPLERAVYEAERNVKSFKRMIDNANEARARHEIVPEGRSAEKHLEMWTAILDALKAQEKPIQYTPVMGSKEDFEAANKPVEVTIPELMDELQVGSHDGEIYIIHALAKKYPAGIKIIDGVE